LQKEFDYNHLLTMILDHYFGTSTASSQFGHVCRLTDPTDAGKGARKLENKLLYVRHFWSFKTS
jgi:hypothetical protein